MTLFPDTAPRSKKASKRHMFGGVLVTADELKTLLFLDSYSPWSVPDYQVPLHMRRRSKAMRQRGLIVGRFRLRVGPKGRKAITAWLKRAQQPTQKARLPRNYLGPAQRQCLELTAAGFSLNDIAAIRGSSRTAAHLALKTARKNGYEILRASDVGQEEMRLCR